jgi:hypothetical protein
MKTIAIDGIEYIQKEETKEEIIPCVKNIIGSYSIVRTYSAGVFAGIIIKLEGQEGVMKNARRLWYWKGAASLSQLTMEGVKYPDECKFPCEVDQVLLTQVIEVLLCTKQAIESINSVPVWKA